jgi:hypothetical protein
MNKFRLLLLLICLSSSLFGKPLNQNQPPDKEFIEINKHIKLLESQVEKLNSKNDSLLKQQIIFKAKEDFYSCALSDQATKYSLITGSLIALLALISYATFKYELNKIQTDFKNELEKHTAGDKEIRDKHLLGIARAYVNGGNTNQIVKLHHEDKEQWLLAVYYNLFAAYNHFLASLEFKETNLAEKDRISKSELNLVTELLNEIIALIDKFSEDDKFTTEQTMNYKKWLDIMTKPGNDDLNDLLATIRTKLKEKTIA